MPRPGALGGRHDVPHEPAIRGTLHRIATGCHPRTLLAVRSLHEASSWTQQLHRRRTNRLGSSSISSANACSSAPTTSLPLLYEEGFRWVQQRLLRRGLPGAHRAPTRASASSASSGSCWRAESGPGWTDAPQSRTPSSRRTSFVPATRLRELLPRAHAGELLHPAIGRHGDALRRNVREHLADALGDLLGRLDLERANVDDADGDRFVRRQVLQDDGVASSRDKRSRARTRRRPRRSSAAGSCA